MRPRSIIVSTMPLRHRRRAPQMARELVLQAGTPDDRADHRGTAGTAQQRGPSREIDALGVQAMADGFVVRRPPVHRWRSGTRLRARDGLARAPWRSGDLSSCADPHRSGAEWAAWNSAGRRSSWLVFPSTSCEDGLAAWQSPRSPASAAHGRASHANAHGSLAEARNSDQALAPRATSTERRGNHPRPELRAAR